MIDKLCHLSNGSPASIAELCRGLTLIPETSTPEALTAETSAPETPAPKTEKEPALFNDSTNTDNPYDPSTETSAPPAAVVTAASFYWKRHQVKTLAIITLLGLFAFFWYFPNPGTPSTMHHATQTHHSIQTQHATHSQTLAAAEFSSPHPTQSLSTAVHIPKPITTQVLSATQTPTPFPKTTTPTSLPQSKTDVSLHSLDNLKTSATPFVHPSKTIHSKIMGMKTSGAKKISVNAINTGTIHTGKIHTGTIAAKTVNPKTINTAATGNPSFAHPYLMTKIAEQSSSITPMIPSITTQQTTPRLPQPAQHHYSYAPYSQKKISPPRANSNTSSSTSHPASRPSSFPLSKNTTPIQTSKTISPKTSLQKPSNTVSLSSNTPLEYTIQLMGSYSESKLKQVKTTLPQSQRILIQKKKHQNKIWFILTYGQYASRQTALQAIAEMPASLQALKPWVRPNNLNKP